MKEKSRKLGLGIAVIIVLLLSSVGTASAHFNFALPDEWSMESEKANNVQLIWGHPYEGIYFDAPKINSCGIIKPDGKREELSKEDIKVEGIEGSAKAYKVTFTPKAKGDYIVYADFEALHVEEEEVTWEDHVKAVIHYKTSEGWDHKTNQIIEIVPITRPYGLEEGFVFTGQVLYNGTPLADVSVEIEKYYPVGEAPDPLPEEPMITRETKTDTNGVFLFTLDEPGIWVTSATNTLNNVDIRGILMIPVEETFPKENKTTYENQKISSLEKNLEDANSKIEKIEKIAGTSIAIAIIAILIAVTSITTGKKEKKEIKK